MDDRVHADGLSAQRDQAHTPDDTAATDATHDSAFRRPMTTVLRALPSLALIAAGLVASDPIVTPLCSDACMGGGGH
jgi:hypothetical protein